MLAVVKPVAGLREHVDGEDYALPVLDGPEPLRGSRPEAVLGSLAHAAPAKEALDDDRLGPRRRNLQVVVADKRHEHPARHHLRDDESRTVGRNTRLAV